MDGIRRESAFAGAPPKIGGTLTGPALVDAVLTGGHPEALARKSWTRRRDWRLDYMDAVLGRDVRDIATIDQLDRMPRLCRVLAETDYIISYVIDIK